MRTFIEKYKNVHPLENFDWSEYEDGWNGQSLCVNKEVKVKNGAKEKVYYHGPNAQELYNAYLKKDHGEIAPKEIKKGSLLHITDLTPLNDDQVLATVNNGNNSIVIDLNKESRWFNSIDLGGVPMTKQTFMQSLASPEHKSALLKLDLVARADNHKAKASIWDGYVTNLQQEMIEQITKNEKAYWATIDSMNNGGYFVTVAGTIKAFMPGSMAAQNRITNFESLLGTQMEVMVENYVPKTGFVVSRKKFLKTILPMKISNLAEELKKNPDYSFEGTVTGIGQSKNGGLPFGVFVELDEYLTGMIHKTLYSDALVDKLMEHKINAGDKIKVYVHRIDNGRIILSDVPRAEQDALVERREKAEEAEKLRLAKATATFNNEKKTL